MATARALDLTIGIATTVIYFAALAAAQSGSVRALRLASAAESLAESAGAAPIRMTRPVVERCLERSRNELGPTRSADQVSPPTGTTSAVAGCGLDGN